MDAGFARMPGSVENEFDFLFDCHLYSSIKEKSDFLSYYSLLNPAFTNLNKMEIYFTNNRQSFDTIYLEGACIKMTLYF